MKKKAGWRIEVNLDELDRIIDRGTRAPLNPSDGQKIKTALRAMADRLTAKRSTEKTAAVLEKPTQAPASPADRDGPSPARHGCQGAVAFAGATKVSIPHATVSIPHATLKSGETCPECRQGKVYRQKEPATLIRIVGQPPLKATIFEMERLRCNACGQIFTADQPETAGPHKYDATAVAMIALLKYGTAFPLIDWKD